jgi:uncharacterized repeat protein (TIGR03803 family)
MPQAGGGWVEKVLHSFSNDGKDGQAPYAGLIFDAAGNLYGTTAHGGNGSCSISPYSGCGTVFELTLKSGGWGEKILHNFGAGAPDGVNPEAGLIFDAAGNLYGTTNEGGDHFSGTAFELTPKSGGWAETILYAFDSGGEPSIAGLIFDAAGNLYGTTSGGGTYSSGEVFELTPKSGGWAETILHPFGNLTDGSNPRAGLILDAAGNLYGTTDGGGAAGGGIAFELTPAGGGIWTETILLNGTTAGCFFHGGLIRNASGNLYGTTSLCGAYGDGVVFEITP